MPISAITMNGKENMWDGKKILFVWFRINSENISNHALNWKSINMNSVQTRIVIEKLMPASAITMYGKENMQEWKHSACMYSF